MRNKRQIPNSERTLYEKELPHYTPVARDTVSARYHSIGNGSYQYAFHTGDNTATILCTGDMLCEEKLYQSHLSGNRFYFHDIFHYVQPLFKKADLVAGNLETTICSTSPYTGEQYKVDGKYHCNAPEEFLDAIRAAGFDFLMLANNHNLDSGYEGILETLENIDERQFMRTGLFGSPTENRVTLVEINGIKIGFLSYSTWYNRNLDRFTDYGRRILLNEYRADKIRADVKTARNRGAEFILVYMHWGVDAEYKSVPSDSMRRMAKEAADAGVDYIIGSHTHSLQPFELIPASDGRKIPCIFSMGNFVTSELASISRETAMLQIRLIKENGLVRVAENRLIPCYIPNSLHEVGYPLLPEGIKTGDSAMNEKMKAVFSHIRNVVGKLGKPGAGDFENCTDYLDRNTICEILGIPVPDGPNEKYTMLNFAMDARKGGVAIISAITSNPEYVTPQSKCAELADLAISKGAKLLIADRQFKDYPTLVVDNVFDAYCRIISTLRSRFDPRTVSITGSIGKTTATEMVYTVLSSKFNTHRNTGSANSVRYAGSVIQGLKKSHEVYVQETMEGPPYGAASTISRLVQPQAAVVTLVGTSHMSAFGSQERILESCLGVQDGMPEEGLLVLNADDPFQRNAGEKCKRRAVYYGICDPGADYRAENIRGEGDSLCFDVIAEGRRTPVRIYCFGHHNVLNALASFAIGRWAGMSEQEIAAGLGKYRTSGIRQNLVSYGGNRIYLDCYNAAPESMKSALDAFAEIAVPSGGRRIGVLADVAEVGDRAEEYHRRIGRLAAESCLDLLICYGHDAGWIAEEAKAAGNFPVYHTESKDELLSLIRGHVTSLDLTLFKGSHSMELEHVVDLIWGTWFHEEFERYDFKTKTVSDEDFTYRVYTDHVTLENKKSTRRDIVIPDTVEGLPVTGIERNAFNGTKYTQSVQLPSGLVNIRYCSFYKANQITELRIPASVRVIDMSAFSTCEKLMRVQIEEGCRHLGYRAFGNCRNLTDIWIPATVRQIGSEAFLNCSKLTIHGEKGSVAEAYANRNKIRFQPV